VSGNWKTVRVFISSTFRDMHAERDHLVKIVFPALREKLEQYRVYLIDIDLRWGVTKEQADNDQVLDLCLQQIDECRPFFVGILGERYGWVPKKFPVEASQKYGWIQHATGKSVTELEILHGVLNNPAMRGYAFFYFRDPEVLKEIPEDILKEVYVETEPDLSNKLNNLKERIRHSGHPFIDSYPSKWDQNVYDRPSKKNGRLVGLEEFGNAIQNQLWKAIKTELKLPDKPLLDIEFDPLAIEQDFHARFIELHTRFYVCRDEIHNELLNYINGNDNRPLIVTGPSGAGKSSILSRICREDLQSYSDALFIPYFIGASSASTSLLNTLKYFSTILKTAFNFELEIPTEIKKLIATFRSFLFSVPENKRLIIVLDGVNQFEESDNPEELAWLPEHLSPNVRIVLSCINDPGHSQRALERAREMIIIEEKVKPLSDEECMEIIKKVPSVSAKTLDHHQITMLIKNSATRNPLYLLIALEELRGFGSFEELNQRISELPTPDDPEVKDGEIIQAIFLQVIERLEQEFNAELVRTSLSLLACARGGLSENEMQDLLSGLSGKEDLFPVLRQLRAYLVKRGEMIYFFHFGLWKAVNVMYLKEDKIKKAYHFQLAMYFHRLNDSPIIERIIYELPFQWAKAEGWPFLKNLFLIPDFLDHWAKRPEDNVKYWKLLEKNDPVRLDEITTLYGSETAFGNTSYETWMNNLSVLLLESGRGVDSYCLLTQLASYYQKAQNDYKLAGTYLNMSNVLLDLGNMQDALTQLNAAEWLSEDVNNKRLMADVLNNKAVIIEQVGDLKTALNYYRMSEKLCREIGYMQGIARSLLNHGGICFRQHEFAESISLIQDARRIYSDNGDRITVARLVIPNLAAALYQIGKTEEAIDYIDQGIQILREIGLDVEIQQLMKYKLKYLGKEKEVTNDLGLNETNSKQRNSDYLREILSLNNRAELLRKKGEYDVAEPLFRKACEICEKVYGFEHIHTATSLNNLGGLLDSKGDYEGAELLYRKALAIYEKISDSEHSNIVPLLNNLSLLLSKKGDTGGAESLCRRALVICEKVLGSKHSWTRNTKNNLDYLVNLRRKSWWKFWK
jgi:nephrocystin-3